MQDFFVGELKSPLSLYLFLVIVCPSDTSVYVLSVSNRGMTAITSRCSKKIKNKYKKTKNKNKQKNNKKELKNQQKKNKNRKQKNKKIP